MARRPYSNGTRAELKGKFAKSTLLPPTDGSPWPIWAISAGCAEWAYKTARDLADEWTKSLGLLRVYETDMRSYGLS